MSTSDKLIQDENLKIRNAAMRPVPPMRLRAYVSTSRRLSAAWRKACRLRTVAEREAFDSFDRRVMAAVTRDPKETSEIEVPWNEWDAFCSALDDQTGG